MHLFESFKSLEMSYVTPKLSQSSFMVFNIYRPPQRLENCNKLTLRIVFDSSFTMSDHNILDRTTSPTIATALIQFKVFFEISPVLNLIAFSSMLTSPLEQFIQTTLRFSHISPVLKSFHWLQRKRRIQN